MNPLDAHVCVQRHVAMRLALIEALVLCGCAGTETGNPSMTRQASVSMVMKSSNSEIAQVCSNTDECEGHGLTIMSAWLSTDYLNAIGCVGQDYSTSAATAWDLLHPIAHKFGTQIPEFCGFSFSTRPGDASLGPLPTELVGASLWLNGTRADNVDVEIQSSAIFKVEKVDPSSPLVGTKLVVAFDAAAWLQGIDVGTLTPGTDGVIRVTTSSNALILQQVEKQTSSNAMLREEEPNDGVTDE